MIKASTSLIWPAVLSCFLSTPAAALPPAAFCLGAVAPSAAALAKAANNAPAMGPQPMPAIHVEGTLPHSGIYDASEAAVRDLGYMRDLALDWQTSGNRQSLVRLAGYLDEWTQTYQPSFNPIDETRFDGLIEAYMLSAADLPPPVALRVQGFLRTLAQGYLAQMAQHRTDKRSVWINNWQSHRIKLATLAAVAIGDEALLAEARSAFIAQLNVNMRADGEVWDFIDRDALHYVTYDLEPLVRAALAAHVRGQDWLHLRGREGQSLAAGLDWLRPYAEGRLRHQEFVHTRVNFDRVRAQAGLKGFGGQWDPLLAKDLYWAASLLDSRYRPLAQALSPSPPRWLWLYASACVR